MSSQSTRPAIDIAGAAPPRPTLALVLALLALPGSTLAWDLPAGGLWIGLPLAVAAIVLARRARREHIGSGRATAAIVIGALCIAQMVVWTAVSVADAKTNGPIIVERNDFSGDGITRLFSVTPGGDLVSITQCATCLEEAPEASPDGQRVYFDSDLVPPIHIFSTDLNGNDLRQETFSPEGFEGLPGISPDGKYLAYDGQLDAAGTAQGIYLVTIGSPATQHRIEAAPPGLIDSSPEWSPDGRTIAFMRFRPSGCGRACRTHGHPEGYRSSVYLMNSDGSNVHRLTPNDGQGWADPAWAPDSKSLLVQTYADRGTRHGISADEYTIDAATGHLTPFLHTAGGDFAFSATYSPDGTRVAFIHFNFGTFAPTISTVAADGSDEQILADCTPPISCSHPTWAPAP